MDSLEIDIELSLDKFNKCGELYRSPPSHEKQYMFLSCTFCKAISWDLDNFFKHLDNTHHTLDNISVHFYKKEKIKDEGLSIMEKSIMEKDIERENMLTYVSNDPLDASDYDCSGLVPDIITKENIEENVSDCNIDIKTEIEITRSEVDFCANEDVNSRNEDYEPDKSTNENDTEDSAVEYLSDEYEQDDESDVTNEENEKTINIKKHSNNRHFIISLIKSYQKHNILWEGNKSCFTFEKNEALRSILKEINEEFPTTLQQVKCSIKNLRFRFIQYLRLKEKGEIKKPLWFFELLKFLEPHLEETKEKTGICTQLNDTQFLALIKLLKENECFWNENNIYHTSVMKKQEILKQITNEFSKVGNFKELNVNIMQNTIDEIILMAKDENTFVMEHRESDNKSNEYKPSNKFFKEIEFLLPHVGPFQCKHCSKIFADIYAYKYHVSKHEGTKPFKCMQCSKELQHKREFVCHIRRHTRECPFQCNTCDKSFPSRKEWHRHVIKHGSKPYVCELCADSFYTQHQLTNHMKNHNNIRDHVCPDCGKGFFHRGLLRQHLQSHEKTKCYCTLCDNIYTNPRSLRRHYIRVHESGQHPSTAYLAQYKCQICKITFPTIQDARQHRKEHRQSNPPEKKHVCDICGHHFAYPKNLADHKKTHSNIRDQVCDVCGKAFTNTNLLNQHKNVHTAEKFVCKACGKDYAHYRGLCRHINKVHGTNIKDLDAKLEKEKLESSA